MAGKSPEKPSHEEQPTTGSSTTADKSAADGPSHIPPTPVISPMLARRLGARVLDPETTVLAPNRPAPLPTVYVADTLLVRDIVDPFVDAGGAKTRVEELIEYAGSQSNPLLLTQVGDSVSQPHRGKSDSLGPDAKVTVTRVRLQRHPTQAGKIPDAWRFLQDALTAPSERARTLYDKLGLGRPPERDDSLPETDEEKRQRELQRERRDRRGVSMASGVSVEHVLTAGGGMWGGGGGMWGGGGGMWGGGGGMWGGGGLLAEYGTAGIGGRTPVVWSAPDPRTLVAPVDHPPVVAVIDTGLGEHPWFPAEDEEGTPEDKKVTAEDCTQGQCPGAHRRVTFGGKRIGVWKEPSRDPENTGVIIDDVNGLVDQFCGHGTFISGIIRQRCPQAVLLEIPVMASDGAALENDIVTALGLLLDRHRAAKKDPGAIPHGILDVVNLSLGYYHETPDEADDSALHDLLRDFAGEGVVVVACAGNDATRARFFPAAFADPGHEALVGVGATNPDDRSIALFTNVGEWVTAYAPGAGVVSTVPTTLSGSLNPPLSVEGYGPGLRAGVDFDDFRCGFALWSGTSFASPWIAGEIAAEVVRSKAAPTVKGGPSRSRVASKMVIATANSDRFPEMEE